MRSVEAKYNLTPDELKELLGSDMKTKVSELIGAALDWAVAKCEGVNAEAFRLYYEPTEHTDYDSHGYPEFHYSTVWAQGGPIIERELIRLVAPTIKGASWTSLIQLPPFGAANFHQGWGETPLIAAMRCYVASKLGDEVEVSEELK